MVDSILSRNRHVIIPVVKQQVCLVNTKILVKCKAGELLGLGAVYGLQLTYGTVLYKFVRVYSGDRCGGL